MDSTISELNKYKSVIDINDFIEFLYSQKIINENDYYTVWPRPERDRLHELFRILDSKSYNKKVFQYLHENYPNNEKRIQDEQNFRKSSVRGGFPKLPPNYVERTSLVADIRRKLLNLEWCQKLVIHGMMGYGKSCLINETLNDITLRKYFDNCLFWINLGDCQTTENVLQPLWRLYSAASTITGTKYSHCPDVQTLKDLLMDLFSSPRLTNSLIILDDACNEDVLTYFDIHCKTVITTQNKNILKNEEAQFVEVKTGFSKTESLELFKRSLKIDRELNGSAEEIHNICQGHPMLISAIGYYLSENTEDVCGDENKIWEYIKNMFLKGNYRLNEFNNEVDIPQIIKKCIEKLLTNSLRDLYQDLAIFEQDVNIPPGVLEILWNKAAFEVRNVMNKFAEKSLIVPFYHNDLKTYIYGIHDIHLNYLKEITKDRNVALHRKLISGYDRVTKGNYANLPNDNYTLQFIGYHLFHAEDFEKFRIYFNLKFLESKVKAVGKEDVLRDMTKYETYITRDEHVLKEKLKTYKDFINRCGGNLYGYDKTDIIQYALRESKESVVFKEALNLANRSHQLYFQLQKPVEVDYSHIININDDITAACFVDSPQHILIGTANGKITLFYEQIEKTMSSFVGHTKTIKDLVISPDRGYFLSVSDDGTVLLWKFSADSARNSRDFTHPLPISPMAKQAFWQDVHTPDRGKVLPKKKFEALGDNNYLISAAFCSNFPDTYRIVTGSKRGNVAIWDALTGENICSTGHRGIETPCVLYLERDLMNLVLFSCKDSILVHTLRNDKLIYYGCLHNSDYCNSLFALDDKYIAVSEKNITLWHDLKPLIVFKTTVGSKNICSTLTNDQKYVVVSTDKNTVYIWDIEENKLIREFENRGLVKSLDTFYDEDKSVHILLMGSDRRTLKQCHILPHTKEPQVESMPVFTPLWKKKNALTAIVSANNQIQVFNGYVQISESEIIKSQVKCTCFSVCGSNVVYGLDSGEIALFNLRSKLIVILDNTRRGTITFLKCYDPNQQRSVSISSTGSTDSLDFSDQYVGVIVSVANNKVVMVYNDQKVLKKEIQSPKIFFKGSQLIIVDGSCGIYIWNIEVDSFVKLTNTHILESVDVTVAAFCLHKSFVGISYEQGGSCFVDIYKLPDNGYSVDRCAHFTIEGNVRSACFSCDGSLMAVGLQSGDIKVWNLNEKHKSIILSLHDDPVEDLLFSPNMEPILVSLGTEIAWWNLKPFQKSNQIKRRPLSIDILDQLSSGVDTMNISFWADRKPLIGSDYLLSCIRLHGRAKYVSASCDFNSFLTVDDNGKVYIMEIISPHAPVRCLTENGYGIDSPDGVFELKSASI